MHYRHVPGGDYTMLAPGHVLLSAPGHPAFPVRLGLELLGRCLEHLPSDGAATLWDPCCGSGALVTTLGLAWRARLRSVLASDLAEDALGLARRNVDLLTRRGLAERGRELDGLYRTYGKEDHRRASEAATRLATSLLEAGGDLPSEVANVDALAPGATRMFSPGARPDVVVTDVPYGRQSHWATDEATDVGPGPLVAGLAAVMEPHAVIAVVVSGRRVPLPPGTRALERLHVGHRAAVIVRAGDVVAPTH